MTTPLRSILLTPNILGGDGVSSLSRQISRVLPEPALVLSLHDGSTLLPAIPGEPGGVSVRGAQGHRGRFVADVARIAVQCTPETNIVCSHLHLAPAARILSWRGAPTTFILCGIEAWVPLRSAERWALDSGDLVAISRHTADRFKAVNPEFASVPITVCHPGLAPATAQRTAAARASEPIALIVARMSAAERYKGHDALLDIWPQVLARHPEAWLWAAGDGDDRPRLEARAASLGIAHSVRFLGHVGDAELCDLYDRCRFFVMPSRDEGFGLVFLEAMRSAKPCIGAAGAAAEIIQHDRTGLIVDAADHAALESAILRLFDEPDTCDVFGQAGRDRFLATFTDEHFRRRFARVMRQPALAPTFS